MTIAQDLVYKPEVLKIIGRSRPWLDAALKNDEFMKPIKIGKRQAWQRPALMAFLGLATIATAVVATANASAS